MSFKALKGYVTTFLFQFAKPAYPRYYRSKEIMEYNSVLRRTGHM